MIKTIWKNANFTKRDPECTNVVAAVGDKPDGNWIVDNGLDLSKYSKLWIEGNSQYYGYL